MSSYRNFVTFLNLCYLFALFYFINFCRLIKLLSASHSLFSSHFFTLSTHPINVPALHTKQHNSHSRLIERTHSMPTHIHNSTCVFGHRAILIKGNRRPLKGVPTKDSTFLGLDVRSPSGCEGLPRRESIEVRGSLQPVSLCLRLLHTQWAHRIGLPDLTCGTLWSS